MIYFGGILITFFLFLLLISKKGKTSADKILAIWLFVIGIHLFLFINHSNLSDIKFPSLLGLDLAFPHLHAPLLYIYTAKLTNQYKGGKFLWILYFFPAFISLYLIFPFLLMSTEFKLAVFQNLGKGFETVTSLNLALLLLFGTLYILLSAFLLRKHARSIVHQFSDIEKINLNWLRYLNYGLSFIWVVILFKNDDYIFTTLVVYVFFLGFFGIRQVGIFSHSKNVNNINQSVGDIPSFGKETILATNEISYINDSNQPVALFPTPDSEKVKYKKSGINLVQSNAIHAELTELMTKEKLYTKPELSLADLAETLQIHPNYLSQVINEKEGKNFYDYINQMRIEEFLRIILLPENKKFTMLTIAYECGFNSKSSFNRYFKKVTGLSPSAYLASK